MGPKKVTTMAVTNKSVSVGDTKVYDMNMQCTHRSSDS